jgi:hypothetical protein
LPVFVHAKVNGPVPDGVVENVTLSPGQAVWFGGSVVEADWSTVRVAH